MTARGGGLLGAVVSGAVGALLLAGPAAAQGLDLSHGGPVQVNAQGIDWDQSQQEVIAHGDAWAVRGNVTVTADTLIAHYRKKKPAPGAPAPATPPAAPPAGTPPGGDPGDETEGSEVYRLDAIGHVHIFTATDQAFGDKGVYDMDQSVLVLTGTHLKLITPQDVITARDSLEYYPTPHMAVARGNAVVLTNDGRRIAADVLVSYSTPDQGNPDPNTPVAQKVAAKPGGDAATDPLTASGKLKLVDAFGNVDVRTATETVHGDRGAYVPDTGRAHIVGHVKVTRGQNQLNGAAAEVNMKTGVATMLSAAEERAAGLIVPNDAQAQAASKPAVPGAAKKPGPAAPK